MEEIPKKLMAAAKYGSNVALYRYSDPKNKVIMSSLKNEHPAMNRIDNGTIYIKLSFNTLSEGFPKECSSETLGNSATAKPDPKKTIILPMLDAAA